ncbi:MAG: dienelactone hydrolase family protein [Rhodospirillaceae bacterium]|nr:dienelactone hydrolase family protein [Rhodospirillaceae bacterium]
MDRIPEAETELKSLLPDSPLSRRGFVVTSLATGFAAAAGPVAAQTMIKTDTAGLDTKEVKIPTGDGAMPAYIAMPAQGGPFPVVYVCHEIFGVHEHLKDICRRLAKAGYLAVSADLYARYGDASKYTMQQIPKLMSDIVAKVAIPKMLTDIDAAVEFAGKNKGNTDKLAVTGFCWGGWATWLYAEHQPKLKAAAAWYGHIMRPGVARNPIDGVKDLKCPVLGLYGAKDQGIPLDTVEMMASEAKKAGKTVEMKVYADAGHGFNADYRASYKKADAEDAWQRMLAWFKKYGAA